ncbi:hypothetical protein T265_15351, partial [Opisthorchis viverrini]
MDTSDRAPMVRNALRETDVISVAVTEEENSNVMTELEGACAVGSNLRLSSHQLALSVLTPKLLFVSISQFVRAFLPDQSQNFYLIGFMVTLLLIPLCWSVDMRILARLSMVANIATMIGTILVLAYLLTAGLQPYNTFPAYTNFQNLLIGFSIVIFAFEGIGMVLPIENKMAHPKGYTDLTGVLNVGMVVVICVCASVGFFGFLNAGDNAQGSITLTIPERPFWFAPIKPLFIFAILVSYLVQYYIPAIIFARLMEKLRCHREASENRRYIHIKTMRVSLVLFTSGYAGVGIVLSEQTEVYLLDWMPVDSRLCAVRLATSVRESRGSEVHRTLFIVSAYAPTDCSSESAKDSFYDALGALLQQAKSSDIVVVAGDMNAQTVPLQYEFPEQRKLLDNVVPTIKPAPNPNRPHRRQLSVARVDHRPPLLLEHQPPQLHPAHHPTPDENECPRRPTSLVNPKGRGNGRCKECWKRAQAFALDSFNWSAETSCQRNNQGPKWLPDMQQSRTFGPLDTVLRAEIQLAICHLQSRNLAINRE